jgi:hypothetical protein
MKKSMFCFFAILNIYSQSGSAAIAWDNPPVLCPEEIFPKGLPCPDFSRVEDPYSDFPIEVSKEEKFDWKNNKAADLRICRNKEVLRREHLKSGSFPAATIELAWMIIDGGKKVTEKVDAIIAASKKYGMPPQVLIGAMKQESLMSSLGVSPDGGNYSCGLAQLNIQEWCQGMNQLSAEKRAAQGWPSINCDSDTLPTDIVKPFYDIAIKNIGERPSYKLSSDDFAGISFKDVNKRFFVTNSAKNRFQAVRSFVNNCQNIALSVDFKALALKNLFDNYVPKDLKNANLYTAGETFPRACKTTYPSNAYPLHTGWLLAVAMYNAGPLQAKIVGSYFNVKDSHFPSITPTDLVEALHWGGKWKKNTLSLEFHDQTGKPFGQSWFKSCIVQRHIARVIQHVTLPSASIAKPLDREGCNQTIVPDYRKHTSGVK